MWTVDLVPLYMAERSDLIDRLRSSLERILLAEARIRKAWFDADVAFDPSRGQHNSTILLRQLLAGSSRPGRKILGVSSVDLFTPVLTFVFGEAQLGGTAAVVSLHRLRPEAYGLPADTDLMFERLEKEAVHELGHTFGLIHCPDASCVMHASTYVEEIDLKPAGFCARCAKAARSAGRGAAQPGSRLEGGPVSV